VVLLIGLRIEPLKRTVSAVAATSAPPKAIMGDPAAYAAHVTIAIATRAAAMRTWMLLSISRVEAVADAADRY